MRKYGLLLSMILVIGGVFTVQAQEKQLIVENRHNEVHQLGKPYVILVSLDGFRYDYIEQYGVKFLSSMGQSGTRAESLIPSYPSVTFPNHYSIVTGMYPGHHGLVGNTMFDRETGDRYSLGNAKAVTNAKWYGGTPLWVLAEQQGMLSACYYWPGSEAPIQDMLPTYSYKYSERNSIENRLDEVEKWLALPEELRPHFITFYMPDVDHAGHRFGPDAPETRDAVHYVDQAMQQLNKVIENSGLPINLIVVSDHGMLALDQGILLELPFEVNKEQLDIASNGTYTSVFVKEKENIAMWYELIKRSIDPNLMEVYLSETLPKAFHFGGEDDRFNRVGDIVITAKAPYYFTNRPLAGSHGYDPAQVKEMHALFLATGPQIQQNLVIRSFENIHIYPLIAKILGLDYDEKMVDGKIEVVKGILQ